jgi:hypothetical protein
MNCQPSFTGGVPLAGPVLEGWPERPRRRVPERDIVYVGPSRPEAGADEPVDVRNLAVAAASRSRHNYTRPLLALLAIEIAALGALYFSKRYAESQVIVVPVPTNERAVIT